jgi:hypothetical protein
VYEIANMLKKNSIDYKIWNEKVNEYVSHVIDDHQIRLKGIGPGMPWIPTCVLCSFLGLWGLLRILGIV